MKLNQLKFTGGYTCPHFAIQKGVQAQKKSCCGRSRGDDYVPVCTLVQDGAMCPGLIACPRLDAKTKSELIKKWRADLQANKVINPPKKV